MVPEHQGHGYGHDLVQAGTSAARGRGFAEILPDVDTLNQPMIDTMRTTGHLDGMRPWHIWHYRAEVATLVDDPDGADRRRHQLSVGLGQRALAITETVNGPEHPTVGFALNTLGGILRDLGDFAAARPLAERALAITEPAYGPDHPAVATHRDKLAAIVRDLGRSGGE